MSRDRFESITQAIHFYIDEAAYKEDHLYKVRNFSDAIFNNPKAFYTPSHVLSLDETMIRFKERHYSKIYMPHKPIKYGFKYFLLCDSNIAFVLEWKLYNRKDKFKVPDLVNHML